MNKGYGDDTGCFIDNVIVLFINYVAEKVAEAYIPFRYLHPYFDSIPRIAFSVIELTFSELVCHRNLYKPQLRQMSDVKSYRRVGLTEDAVQLLMLV